MRAARRASVLAVVACAASAGCAAALPHPTAQHAISASERWPGTSLRDLERGRALYVRRCSGCHSLFLPRSRPAAAWPVLVETMSERSRLRPEEAADITRLLVTLAARDAP